MNIKTVKGSQKRVNRAIKGPYSYIFQDFFGGEGACEIIDSDSKNICLVYSALINLVKEGRVSRVYKGIYSTLTKYCHIIIINYHAIFYMCCVFKYLHYTFTCVGAVYNTRVTFLPV